MKIRKVSKFFFLQICHYMKIKKIIIIKEPTTFKLWYDEKQRNFQF